MHLMKWDNSSAIDDVKNVYLKNKKTFKTHFYGNTKKNVKNVE